MEMTAAAVKVVGPQDAARGLPREHRRPLHDRRGRRGRALLARRASDVAARARRAAAPPHARGRVQLRARGPHGRAAGRRRRRGRPGRPGLQAAQPVAHVLERGRRALPDPRDHLAGRLRALLPRALRHGRRDRGGRGRGRRAQRALRPRDAAGDGPRPGRALRAADRRAALRRLDARGSASARAARPPTRRRSAARARAARGRRTPRPPRRPPRAAAPTRSAAPARARAAARRRAAAAARGSR